MTLPLAGLITFNGGQCGYRTATRQPLTFRVFAPTPVDRLHTSGAAWFSCAVCKTVYLCVSLLLRRLHHSDRSRAAAL